MAQHKIPPPPLGLEFGKAPMHREDERRRLNRHKRTLSQRRRAASCTRCLGKGFIECRLPIPPKVEDIRILSDEELRASMADPASYEIKTETGYRNCPRCSDGQLIYSSGIIECEDGGLPMNLKVRE